MCIALSNLTFSYKANLTNTTTNNNTTNYCEFVSFVRVSMTNLYFILDHKATLSAERQEERKHSMNIGNIQHISFL